MRMMMMRRRSFFETAKCQMDLPLYVFDLNTLLLPLSDHI